MITRDSRLATILALTLFVLLTQPAAAQPATGSPAWYEDRQCGFRFPLPRPWVFKSRPQNPSGPVSVFARPDWPAPSGQGPRSAVNVPRPAPR